MTSRKPPSSYVRLRGERKQPSKKKQRPNYIDNQLFLEAITVYRKKAIKAKEKGQKPPPITDELGEFFLKIARNLSNCYCFANYPFKEDMELDAVKKCLRSINNFDITPSDKPRSPFAYFSTVSYWEFLRHIKDEKKALASKFKAHELQLLGEDVFHPTPTKHFKSTGFFNEDPFLEKVVRGRPEREPKMAYAREYMSEYIDSYDNYNAKKSKEKKDKKKQKELDDLSIGGLTQEESLEIPLEQGLQQVEMKAKISRKPRAPQKPPKKTKA